MFGNGVGLEKNWGLHPNVGKKKLHRKRERDGVWVGCQSTGTCSIIHRRSYTVSIRRSATS